MLAPTTHLARVSGSHTPNALALKLRELAALLGPDGTPVFLRTGWLAGKLRWRETCWVTDRSRLSEHVLALAQESAIHNLPLTNWAVRQALPLAAYAHLRSGCPLACEFRVTVQGADVLCWHPLWPADALEQAMPVPEDWFPRHQSASELGEEERRVLLTLSAHVGRVFAEVHGEASWCLKWALLVDGRWVLLDMMAPELCWHWPRCPNAPIPADERRMQGREVMSSRGSV